MLIETLVLWSYSPISNCKILNSSVALIFSRTYRGFFSEAVTSLVPVEGQFNILSR